MNLIVNSQAKKLTDLPNIGKTLAEKLLNLNIANEQDLRTLGSKQVFIKLYSIEPNVCYNTLYAIEGAIQGIRWHSLDKERKNELKLFCDKIKQ